MMTTTDRVAGIARRAGPEDIAPELLAPVRAACTALPGVREVPAWIGVRWQVRTQTFAHLMVIEDGRPQAFVRAAGTAGPATVLMFRSASPELEVLRGSGPPFFAAPWFGGASSGGARRPAAARGRLGGGRRVAHRELPGARAPGRCGKRSSGYCRPSTRFARDHGEDAGQPG